MFQLAAHVFEQQSVLNIDCESKAQQSQKQPDLVLDPDGSFSLHVDQVPSLLLNSDKGVKERTNDSEMSDFSPAPFLMSF